MVCYALSRGLYHTDDLFSRIPIGQPWLPTIGGLIVGAIGFFVPQTLGVGYDVITSIIDSKVTVGLAVVIMVAKAVSWMLSMGSQTSGGTLAPLFMVGSALGLAFGSGVESLFPGLGVVPGAYAIAGMAAVFGTASRAPFASIVFALEVTEAYQGVLPVIVTVVIAELVGEYLMEDSIMTEKLARRGLRVRHIYEVNPLRQVRVEKLMSPLIPVDAGKSALALFGELRESENHLLPNREKHIIVLKDKKPIGVMEEAQLYTATFDGDPKVTVEQVCSKNFLTIREDEFAYEAQTLITLKDAPFLVVLNRDHTPVGCISRGDLISAQRDKIAEDKIIERGLLSRLFAEPEAGSALRK